MSNESKTFKHLVFTNFGVGIFDIRWLMYRLEIFKNTVLVSLENQTNKNFEWIIFIHKDAPSVFKVSLNSAIGNSSLLIRLVEVEAYDVIGRGIGRIVDKIDEELLISSRIDDDDIIDANVVNNIHMTVKSQSETEIVNVISLIDGAEFLPMEQIAAPRQYESIALFLTMVSERYLGTFYAVNHFAHHCIIESLNNKNIIAKHIRITETCGKPLYAYIKHPLSDSFYAGAKARIENDQNKYQVNESNFAHLGLSKNNLDTLKKLLLDCPNGMPYKYMAKINECKANLKSTPSDSFDYKNSLFKIDFFENHATRSRPWAQKKRNKMKVAILGSCVTRDLFSIMPSLAEKFEVCFYAARSSVVSYLSFPNQDENLKVDIDNFESKRGAWDLEKTHWQELRLSQPDLILFDFIDERIGVINHQGGYFSASPPIIKSFENANKEYDILRPWSDQIVSARDWAVPCFIEKLSNICDNLILHKAAWASEYYKEKNKMSFSGGEWETLIELNNNILTPMFNQVEQSHYGIDSIGGSEVGMVAGGKHLWSFCPYHYDTSYYKTLARQLEARVF
jgi:hypothetical protein